MAAKPRDFAYLRRAGTPERVLVRVLPPIDGVFGPEQRVKVLSGPRAGAIAIVPQWFILTGAD